MILFYLLVLGFFENLLQFCSVSIQYVLLQMKPNTKDGRK